MARVFDELRRDGHFAYESGDHGDTWLDLDRLLADPRRFDDLCGRLADKLRRYRPDVVCGPLLGGAFVGHAVARHLDIRFVYTAPPQYDVPEPLRSVVDGARVVVVDDVINAGSATSACVRAIEARGGTVAATAALAVRVPGNEGIERLTTMQWNIWPASECPQCQRGVPIDTA